MTKTAKQEQKPTTYMVLGRDDGRSWSEVGVGEGRKGEEAIKQVAKVSTGSDGDSYKSGEWKAVPLSTWNSEGNNVVIVSETRVVTSFLRPPGTNGSAKVAEKV